MVSFKRTSGPGLRVRLDSHESDLLRELLEELRTLVTADLRADPVVRRLYPDAHDAEDEARAYRDLVGDDLQTAKREAIDTVEKALGNGGRLATVLPEHDVDAWLTVLTDLRLAIGTRLEVTEELMEQELDAGDPRAAGLSVLHWLGWLQELMLRELG